MHGMPLYKMGRGREADRVRVGFGGAWRSTFYRGTYLVWRITQCTFSVELAAALDNLTESGKRAIPTSTSIAIVIHIILIVRKDHYYTTLDSNYSLKTEQEQKRNECEST